MNEFTEYKLKSLSSWLLKRAHSDEYCEANLLKTAISIEEATNTLNMSKRVPRTIKGLIWDLSEKYKQSFDYDKKDLEDLSAIYRAKIMSFVDKDPNTTDDQLGRAADLSPEHKAKAIQWLTSLGSNDKSFAKKTLLLAIEAEGAGVIKGSLLYRLKAKLIEEDNRWPVSMSVAIIKNKLEKFYNWKDISLGQQNIIKEKDLPTIKSLKEFFEILEEADKAIEEYNKNKEYLNADIGTEELEATEGSVSGDAWRVYVIKNKGAACKIGAGTEWCTAAPGADWFGNYYHEKDPLFVVEHKRDENERFQVHFGTKQFKDTEDEEVSPPGVVPDHRNKLIKILNDFGSNKYLSSQLYNSYENFKAKGAMNEAISEEEFKDLHAKFTSYMNEVMEPKIEDDSLEDPGSYLPSMILDQISYQIKTNDLIGDDDEVSDLAAKMMADHSPNEFFKLSLDVDYPEFARDILDKAINPEGSTISRWAQRIAPLNLYKVFISGDLFQSDSVNDFLKASPESRSKLALTIVRKHGVRIFLHKEPMAAEAAEILEEYYPELYSDIAKALSMKATGDPNWPFTLQVASYSGSNAGSQKDLVWKAWDQDDSAAYLEMEQLIESGFSSQFPDEFKKMMDSILIYTDNIRGADSARWLGPILDAMSEANIIQKYWSHYIGLLKYGLKVDFDKYSEYDNASFPEDMRSEIHQATVAEETEYVGTLLADTDRHFPGWRTNEYDGYELYEIFATIEGSSPSAQALREEEASPYKPVAEFYHKILSILKRKLSESSAGDGSRIKLKLPKDFLLYLATLLPSLWSVYNLEYKAVVPSEITAKAHRSMRKLEQEISLRKQDEPKKDSEDSEEDDDWDDDDDF
jgi:hypothetical protein